MIRIPIPMILAGALAMPLLGGCAGSVANGYLLMLESGSVVATDKTVSDHIVSRVTGRDCSSVRVERGESYCIESVPRMPAPPEVYCQETLGDVECHARPDAYGQGRRAIAHPGSVRPPGR